jgi:dTDP-4-dehydrorhamnose reductase
MLYLSTDYVFDGQGTEPWKPDYKNYKPLNVYGQTKLEGELAVSDKQYGLSTRVIPVTTEEYGLIKAARPVNSRLDKSKLVENGFEPLSTWQDAVKRYLKEAQL